MSRNLARRFAERAREDPKRPALRLGEDTWSYGELGEAAARVAGWLAAEGLGRGHRVGVLGSRAWLAYAGILGAAWSGATYVPMNPRHPAARLLALLERASLDALVVAEDAVELLDDSLLSAAPGPVLASSAEGLPARVTASAGLAGRAPLDEPVALEPDDLAYLMFTSGTTGVPKGVMVTVGNVDHFLGFMQARYGISPEDRVSQFFELTFDLSVFDLFMTWSHGACLHVLPEAERLNPVRFIQDHALSVWFSVPSAVAFMRRVKALVPDALPSLRLSLFCGEPLPESAVLAWREAAPASRIENLYGPTEATVACLLEPCDDELVVTPDRSTVAIGRPYDGMHAAILSSDGRFLEPGQPGELLLSGAQVTAGYWRDPELTAERYPTLDHPELGPRRFYRTGDLAYREGDGRFHHLGRVDNQVKIQGHRVELEEVDARLRDLCGDEAAAVAWPIREGTAEGIVAFVTAGGPSTSEIRDGLKRSLPSYMIPRRVISLERLPLTLNGKIDRNALRHMLEGRDEARRS